MRSLPICYPSSYQKNIFLLQLGLLFFLIFFAGCTENEDEFTLENEIIVTDIDGNSYRTKEIGNHLWMVENLKVTHYNDGTPIPFETENKEWCLLKTGASCNFNNDSFFVSTYGRLYNWYVVSNSKKIAPKGWHVATEQEWAELVEAFGGDSIAGFKLKEEGTINWEWPNNDTDNGSNFTGLPGGFRSHVDGKFYGVYGHGFWWTSSSIDNETAYAHALGYRNGHAGCCITDKSRGFSIRCVKD